MYEIKPKEIRTHRIGATYIVPTHSVLDGRGIVETGESFIEFVKGDKSDQSKFRQSGFVIETLLQVCKNYLEDVNIGDLIDDEAASAISHINGALAAIERRAEKCKAIGVHNTYKPIQDGQEIIK